MITTKTIRLDVTKKYTEPIYLVQYEVDARILDIYLSAGSLPINLTGASVEFYAKKPDGTILFNNCTVVDAVSGHVVYTVTEQMCAVAGDLRCWILVIKDDAELRSIEFKVTVQPSEDDTEAIESTSEFTALYEALSDIDALQQETQALQQETQALKTGWIPLNGVATFNSVDNPTGVINVPSGHGIEVGNRVRLSNASRVIYGIVTAVTATTVTFLHEINPSNSQALNLLVDSAITDVCFSRNKLPSGFPVDPRKWTISVYTTSNQSVSNPSTSWQRAGTISLTVPIGAWCLNGKFDAQIHMSDTVDVYAHVSISTSTTEPTNPRLTHIFYFSDGTINGKNTINVYEGRDEVALSAKTTYYVIMRSGIGSPNLLQLNGLSGIYLWATCAYL
jgi:hypothetical protein